MKRWRIILIVFALVAVGVLVVCLVQPAEPSYQGRKLSDWLADCTITVSNGVTIEKPDEIGLAAVRAVKEIGTNAIPYLLCLLKSEDSTLKTNINKVLAKQTLIRFRFQTYREKADMAMLGFHILHEAAAPVIPELTQIASSQETRHRIYALLCLQGVTRGNEWKSAIRNSVLPLLLKSLDDTNLYVRREASIWLYHRFPEDAEKAGLYLENGLFPTRPPRSAPAVTNVPATNK